MRYARNTEAKIAVDLGFEQQFLNYFAQSGFVRLLRSGRRRGDERTRRAGRYHRRQTPLRRIAVGEFSSQSPQSTRRIFPILGIFCSRSPAANESPAGRLLQNVGGLLLRHGDAVIALGIIGRGRVAELNRTAGQCICRNRNPDSAGQIRAGFHHNGEVVGSGNFESEPV